MSQVQAKRPTDTWVNATWDEYIKAIGDPAYEKARGYYYNGRMRLEMSALGNPHSRDHFIVIAAIALFAGLNQIDFDGHDNCTYRKTNCAEAQPDVSFYLGANAETVPWEVTIISKVSSCWFISDLAPFSTTPCFLGQNVKERAYKQ